jgi:formylglycine-generating enzyme required for sulfatase activity
MRLNLTICTLLLVLALATVAGGAEEATVSDPTTGMEFVFVKGGCYKMGDTIGGGDADEIPVHEVCVSDFYLGKYEVTQSQWEKVMGDNPATFKECGPECPVESINWNTIQDYIKRLNGRSGKTYRLPTEAEWEYAARSGGKEEKWSGTSDKTILREFAWFVKNSGTMAQRVGQKKPNGLGLHDMSGNVIEWCQDWYDAAYYATSRKDNPSGPPSGEKRARRGGSWDTDEGFVRTAKRDWGTQTGMSSDLGFRLLLPAR